MDNQKKLFVMALALFAQMAWGQGRSVQMLNFGWQFYAGDKAGLEQGADKVSAAELKQVQLPWTRRVARCLLHQRISISVLRDLQR